MKPLLRTSVLKSTCCLLLFACLFTQAVWAQKKVRRSTVTRPSTQHATTAKSGNAAPATVQYQISFSNAVHHEAEVKLTLTNFTGSTAQLRMARSSPGRYALHEFAKNVYNLSITNSKGEPLDVTRPNLHQWDISGIKNTVIVTYTVYGNRADGTYNQIDETHAHLNMPATFAYFQGLDDVPLSVKFQKPEDRDWTVATQLRPEPDGSFYAPDLQYLMDSPTELAAFRWREWKVARKSGSDSLSIRLAVHDQSNTQSLDKFTEKIKKIVAEEKQVFGDYPKFDYGQYTFIACYMPQASGDGMEHRNSTFLTSSGTIAHNETDLLGTVSHEFFHCWNVERIRPKSLEPFRFQDANMSAELWLAEGFTNYYGELLLKRAGIYTEQEYLASLAAELNSYYAAPGARKYSPVYMSQQAPFVDAARSVDPVNRANTYLSYYTFGGVVAAFLDLSLRSRAQPHSLDAYMQLLWNRYGKTEKPYTLKDLEQTLADLTQDPAYASSFFSRYIYGSELMVFQPLLEKAGIGHAPGFTRKATLGPEYIAPEKAGLRIMQNTLLGSPLYAAGLEQNDLITKLEGKKATLKNLEKILKSKKPDDALTLNFTRYNQTKTATVTLAEDKLIHLSPIQASDASQSQKQQLFKSNWLDTNQK